MLLLLTSAFQSLRGADVKQLLMTIITVAVSWSIFPPASCNIDTNSFPSCTFSCWFGVKAYNTCQNPGEVFSTNCGGRARMYTNVLWTDVTVGRLKSQEKSCLQVRPGTWQCGISSRTCAKVFLLGAFFFFFFFFALESLARNNERSPSFLDQDSKSGLTTCKMCALPMQVKVCFVEFFSGIELINVAHFVESGPPWFSRLILSSLHSRLIRVAESVLWYGVA